MKLGEFDFKIRPKTEEVHKGLLQLRDEYNKEVLIQLKRIRYKVPDSNSLFDKFGRFKEDIIKKLTNRIIVIFEVHEGDEYWILRTRTNQPLPKQAFNLLPQTAVMKGHIKNHFKKKFGLKVKVKS